MPTASVWYDVPVGNTPMIASDVQQRIDRLAEQLGNLRGYL